MRKTKMAKILEKIKLGAKETLRKFLVSLKRNPQFIPLATLVVSFLVFSLNLTSISNTTAYIYGSKMGLCAFVSMLLSILSFICVLNAFPKRQRPNIPMMLLLEVIYSIVIFADYTYYSRIVDALSGMNLEDKQIQEALDKANVYGIQKVMIAHIVLVGITMVCIALEPLFAKLLRKINTSVDVEDNGKIEEIELTDED